MNSIHAFHLQNNFFEDERTILNLLALAYPQEKYFYTNKYIHLNDSLQDVENLSAYYSGLAQAYLNQSPAAMAAGAIAANMKVAA